MSRLTFWQNVPSIHQAPLIRAVAAEWPGRVIVVTDDGVPAYRRNQGWHDPDFGGAELVVGPDAADRWKLLEAAATPDDVHIFSGFHAYDGVSSTLVRAVRLPVCCGVFAEPGRRDDGAPKVMIRRLRHRLSAWRFGDRLDFVLATGGVGAAWYARSGFPPAKIFPFGYFVEDAPDAGGSGDERFRGPICNFLFVGELQPHKGVDLLFRSLAVIRSKNWRLSVVGQGSARLRLEGLARRLKIASRIRWLGMLSNREVRSVMNEADCMVLPSRHDGWGAVVNEALMAGLPVVASDRCGASDLLTQGWCGTVVASGNAAALAAALERYIVSGPPSRETRDRIRQWAERAIAPTVAARYLMCILQYVMARGDTLQDRPVPPWHD